MNKDDNTFDNSEKLKQSIYLGMDKDRSDKTSLFLHILSIRENIIKFRQSLEEKKVFDDFSLTQYGFEKLLKNFNPSFADTSIEHSNNIVQLKGHVKQIKTQLDLRCNNIKKIEMELKDHITNFEESLKTLTSSFRLDNEFILPLSNEIMIDNIVRKQNDFKTLIDKLADNQYEFSQIDSLEDDEKCDLEFYRLYREYTKLYNKLQIE